MKTKFNLRKYQNFDEFVSRNNIEILSFNGRVYARWITHLSYKKNSQRINEKKLNQISGADYFDLTKKLKFRFSNFFAYPGGFIMTSICMIIMIIFGFYQENSIFITLGSLIGLISIYYSIVETIETLFARGVLKSNSTLSKDFIKPNFLGNETLFEDVFKKIEEEKAKTYADPIP